MWGRPLSRNRQTCLFFGAATPRRRVCYFGLPEGAKDLVADFLHAHGALPQQDLPEQTDVELLVGDELHAKAFWEVRVTCSLENPEGGVMYGA